MSSASKSAILGLDKVSFSYEKGSPFIRDLSFGVSEGDFVGLLGANGSGKSTIMKLGCGILKTVPRARSRSGASPFKPTAAGTGQS